MKLNNLAKTVVLGLAVLLASSAFASNNKGSLLVGEAFEVNGQQLPAGEYQVRWDGTGATVEVSFMGKKELAKTSAKMVPLDTVSYGDSAVVDHNSGKAAISEIRFSGKKFALVIGPTDKAEMNGTSK